MSKPPPKSAYKIFIVLAVICICLISSQRLLNNYELLCYDLLFSLRPAQPVNQDIVIIEIAEDTLEKLGTWPIPRDYHASLVDVLRSFGVRMVIFDIFFTTPTQYDPEFGESIQKAGNVYLAQVLDVDNRLVRKYTIPESQAAIADNSLFSAYSNLSGHINTFVDPDGKVRRVPLFIQHKGSLIPQMSFKAACDYLGLDVAKVVFKPRSVTIDGKLTLPVSFMNSFLVNYPGYWVKTFKHLSYVDIIKSFQDQVAGKSPKIDLKELQGKVCFIGLTATGTWDVKPTPLETSYFMVGLQTSVFNSIVTKNFIREVPVPVNVVLILAMFFASLLICLRLRPVRAFLGVLGLGVFYFLAAAFLFAFKSIWIDIVSVLAVALCVYILTTIYRFLDEIKKRQLLEKELEIARDIQKSFLPEDIHEFKNLKISSFMQPAKFVGGDLYDFIPLDENRLGVFIADVSGKGVPAALIMAKTISLLRIFARGGSNPAQVLTQLNKELVGFLQGKFVTALYVIVDVKKGIFEASCAGHFPVLVFSVQDNQVVEAGGVSGPPLGVLDSLEYEYYSQPIKNKDMLFLYTDGVLEARNKKQEEFGLERIKALLSQCAAAKQEPAMECFKKEILKFFKGLPQHDDITMLMVEV